jgi:fructose-1,6-bisphosphatase I
MTMIINMKLVLCFLWTATTPAAAFSPSLTSRSSPALWQVNHRRFVETLPPETAVATNDEWLNQDYNFDNRAAFVSSKVPSRRQQSASSAFVPRKGMTLSQYMREMAHSSHAADRMKDMQPIFESLERAFSLIAALIRRSSLEGITGLEGTVNVQGEEQKKLDVITNNVLKQVLHHSGKLGVIASEEEDVPVLLCDDLRGAASSEDHYVAVFDPLDGSSNVDANVPTGTIFGIFDLEGEKLDTLSDHRLASLEATLQPGKNLVAAGYCLYSGATTLVFTLGDGVHGFTLDDVDGEFRLTHPNIRIPSRGNIYSFNEANRWNWDEPLQRYITAIQTGQGETGETYSARYIGSMVGDIHRTLLYGGIFGYPADRQKNPSGKLRLLYEAAPMSFLMEQAGGMAVTGKEQRIMALKPQSIHQRTPCILGSQEDVLEVCHHYQQQEEEEDANKRQANRPKVKRTPRPFVFSGRFCR